MRFQLLDEILELTAGREITARRQVVPGEEYFQDHFPGFPVVPGVLLTEMIAQAAGKCLMAEDMARGVPMLAKIAKAGFRDWVQPGQTLTVRAQIRSSRLEFATAEGWVEVDGRRVAEAELLFTFVAHEQFGVPFHDPVLARFLEQRPGASGGRASRG